VLCPKENPEPHNEENVGFLPHCLKMVFALSCHCVLVCCVRGTRVLEISLYQHEPSAEQAAEVSDEWVNAGFLPLSSFHSLHSYGISYFLLPGDRRLTPLSSALVLRSCGCEIEY
jgi:hypothetical protein